MNFSKMTILVLTASLASAGAVHAKDGDSDRRRPPQAGGGRDGNRGGDHNGGGRDQQRPRPDRGGDNNHGGNQGGGRPDRGGDNNHGGHQGGGRSDRPDRPDRGNDSNHGGSGHQGGNQGGQQNGGGRGDRDHDRDRDRDRDRDNDRDGRNHGRDHDRRDGRNHGRDHDRRQPYYPPVYVPPYEPYEPYYPEPIEVVTGEKSVLFTDLTRRTGGEWLRVVFDISSFVDYVSVTPLIAPAVIHEAYLVTISGRRIPLSSFTLAGLLQKYQPVSSRYITAGERIKAIDLRVEAMGPSAAMTVTVKGSQTPVIRAQRF